MSMEPRVSWPELLQYLLVSVMLCFGAERLLDYVKTPWPVIVLIVTVIYFASLGAQLRRR